MTAPLEFMRFTAPDPAALQSAIAAAEAALPGLLAGDNRLARVECVAELGGLLTTARREAEAVQLLRAHMADAEAEPRAEPSAWFWNALATALQYTGEHEAAQAYFSRAVSLAQAGGWQRIEAMTLHHWGRCLVERGRLDEAEQRIGQALKIREAMNAPIQASSRQALAALAELRALSVSPPPAASR